MQALEKYKKLFLALTLSTALCSQSLAAIAAGNAVSIGVVNPMPAAGINRPHYPKARQKGAVKKRATASHLRRGAKNKSSASLAKNKKKAVAKVPAKAPQDAISSLSSRELAPGVVHKCHRGPLNINILDVDLNNPDIEVKPLLASETFNRLDEVRDQAQRANAIAAVNANYFKKDGTPLGTLVIDGEWISGPLYDRISFGLTDSGRVHVDRANLHGTIETSNPEIPSLWVNNLNQPRRHGCKLVAYTRRWGPVVRMPYAGTLVAVDASGRVVDKSTQVITVPYGGLVLSDSKSGQINKLKRGDLIYLQWHERPESWKDVIQAVSGGPALIRNGKLFLDLKDENFRKNWTSSSIHARTALGVTRNNHLILATIEGPHTLWDAAKMLHRLGCVEAMNLDGGGSTTMVLKGQIVTRNKNSYQRRVAASLAVLPRSSRSYLSKAVNTQYEPTSDISPMLSTKSSSEAPVLEEKLADPLSNVIQEKLVSQAQAESQKLGEISKAPQNGESQVINPQPPLAEKKKDKKSRKFGWMKGVKGLQNLPGFQGLLNK
ncbi:MAG: phosphodiester glycosidase family protein [Candidatus Obscuribacterales bacterium]|nr:phosphodiester glycosidase family protein [Candidatus Obscuribacterales bacterium]